jgi:uncharacterized CHY-type Zn-finger protein
MTGFVLAYSACFACHIPFSFNPHKVPSFRVNGEREAICASCMAVVNAKRKEMSLEPHPIEPDAYEPLPEEKL